MRREIEQIPKTALEVFKMLPEGTLCEVIDNVLYMSPSPTSNHQRILFKISNQIFNSLKDSDFGEAFISPLDVFLDEEKNAVQPDIFFISKEHAHIVKNDGIHGVPDVIIELLSTNRTHDTLRKYELYQKKGIKEYIIIDPETKEVWQYVLENNLFVQHQKSSVKGNVKIALLNLDIEF